jgi:predicted Zn-dependent peptidase
MEAGAICTFFSVDSKNLERSLEIFHAELDDIRRGGVREEEIASAKAQVKGGIVFGIENPESRLFQLIQSEAYYGRYVTCAEILRSIERVSRRSVTEAAERYLGDGSLTYTTCGPIPLRGIVS